MSNLYVVKLAATCNSRIFHTYSISYAYENVARVLIGKRILSFQVCVLKPDDAGTTAYVYNNTRCKHLARHVVEHMVSIMRLTAMISIPYTVTL